MKSMVSAEHSKFWLGDSFNHSKVLNGDSIVDLIKLASYRRAISNFVYILTNKNIPVRFAENSTSLTDGKVIYIGGELSKGEFDVTVGLSLHEAMHIVKSDFDLIKIMWGKLPRSVVDAARGRFTPDVLGQLAKFILNVVEDRYIDAWAYDTAVGYRGYYQALYNRYFYSEEIGVGLASDAFRNPTIKNYKFRFCNIMHPKTDLDALPALRRISELLDLPNILRPEMSSPEDRMELAFQITEEIIKSVVEDKVQAGEQKSDPNNEPGDNTGENSSADAILGGVEASTEPMVEDGDEPEENPSDDLSEKELKQIEKFIKDQEDFISHNTKPSKFDSDTIKKLNILEKSDIGMVPVGGEEGVPEIDCIVVKNMTKELMESTEFPYTSKLRANRGNPESGRGVKEGIALGTTLGRRLQIRNEIRTTKFSRLVNGRIDKRLLSDLGFQGENIFYQTTTDKYKSTHVHVTVDASSSMERKWKKTMVTVVAIAKAASMINNVSVSISFRSGVLPGSSGSLFAEEMPYVVLAYDSRKDKFSKIIQLFPALFPNGSTPEGLAFQAILDNIPASTSELDSYFVNLSDGEPAFGSLQTSYTGPSATLHTKKQVNKIRDNGVTVLSYFIESEEDTERVRHNTIQFKSMYGRDAQFIDVENVVQVAQTLNKKFLEKE